MKLPSVRGLCLSRKLLDAIYIRSVRRVVEEINVQLGLQILDYGVPVDGGIVYVDADVLLLTHTFSDLIRKATT